MTRVLTAIACGFFLVPAAHAQKPRDPEQDKVREESNRIENAAERLTRPQETERDRYLKEVSRIKTVDPNEATKSEPVMIYDRMTGGAPEWTYEMARQRGMKDLFERAAGRMNLAADRMSRDQFLSYASSYLRPENSPPYRTPAEDEDRAFRELDRNQDGVLDPGEATQTLREAAGTYDRNRNNTIERGEYTEYFKARVQVMFRKMEENRIAREAKEAAKQGIAPPPQQQQSPTLTALRPTDPRAKTDAVEAVRFGHLPRGLPEWFAALDTDRDGQVGLYEWRRASRSLEEFALLDQNEDGLVTSDEWLRFTRTNPDEAARYAPPASNGQRGISPVSLKMR